MSRFGFGMIAGIAAADNPIVEYVGIAHNTSNPFSQSIDLGTGQPNTKLIVLAAAERSSTVSAPTDVTIGGDGMEEVASLVNVGDDEAATVWYLDDAAGKSGNQTVAFTWSQPSTCSFVLLRVPNLALGMAADWATDNESDPATANIETTLNGILVGITVSRSNCGSHAWTILTDEHYDGEQVGGGGVQMSVASGHELTAVASQAVSMTRSGECGGVIREPVTIWVAWPKAGDVGTGLDLTGSATVTAGTEFGGAPISNLTDGSLSTHWSSTSGSTAWVQAQFSRGQIIDQMTWTARNSFPGRAPKTWTLEGSQDGLNWTVLHSVTNDPKYAASQKKTFEIINLTAYLYYRMNMTATTDGTSFSANYQGAEWELIQRAA